jgi:hypothetical protein
MLSEAKQRLPLTKKRWEETTKKKKGDLCRTVRTVVGESLDNEKIVLSLQHLLPCLSSDVWL